MALARLWLGASQLAIGTQDGAAVAPANTNFPFALVFDPAPGLNSVPCEYNNYTSQLQNLGSKWVGKPFYDVYAVAGPWSERPAGKPSLEHIGSLVLDSPFTTSMYGDAQLFFRRLFWDTELEHRKRTGDTKRWQRWAAYANSSENYKQEGAAWYQPFLPQHCFFCYLANACLPQGVKKKAGEALCCSHKAAGDERACGKKGVVCK